MLLTLLLIFDGAMESNVTFLKDVFHNCFQNCCSDKFVETTRCLFYLLFNIVSILFYLGLIGLILFYLELIGLNRNHTLILKKELQADFLSKRVVSHRGLLQNLEMLNQAIDQYTERLPLGKFI